MKNRVLILAGLMMLWAVTAVAANAVAEYTSTAKSKKFTLVVDAGHGGHDTGAVGPLTNEKTINLNVALAFGRLVERNCPDVNVIYTRKTDVFIPLHTRADIANRNKADLFISVHTNALPKGRISRGMETYTLGMHRAADNLAVAKRENEVILYEKDYKQRYQGFDPNSSESYIMFEFMQDHNMAQSVELAKFVQKRTCASAGRQNKGVKQAGFLVLRETSMPSCLIELGFISTPDEERFLHSADGVSRLAQGIYQAFLDYKRKYDGNITVPYKAETKQEVTVPTVVPQDEAKVEKKEKKEKKKKSKMAQELADAREGKDDQPVAEAQSTPSVDSIVNAALVAQPVQRVPASHTAQNAPTPQNAQTAPAPQNAQSTPASQPAPVGLMSTPAPTAGPVFKVQILASTTRLKANDPQLKGQKSADFYQENGLYKYTVGASADYSEIAQLRKTLAASFPQAFIIAFKDGQKMNVQAAIQEYKNNKK
ncbi:MAG: N-acetylmuramoyl-L-alanine amidase [Prevotella sp.]|nr:N-acetylmuramoyl-L-alanine amidase [Prevotella sp.]